MPNPLMKSYIQLLCILVIGLLPQLNFALPIIKGNSFFVTPTGSPAGDGSASKPWDFQTALQHPSVLKSGDVIWLRAGTYHGPYVSSLNGSRLKPIVVRAYPNERVIVDDGSSGSLLEALSESSTKCRISNSERWPVGTIAKLENEEVSLFARQSQYTHNSADDNYFSCARGWNGSAVSGHAAGIAVPALGHPILHTGSYTWFWGLEIATTRKTRIVRGMDLLGGMNFVSGGVGNRAINLQVRNTGHPGIGWWNQGDQSEMYGNILSGNGIYDEVNHTTLGSAVSATDTTISLADSSFYSSGRVIQIDSEFLRATAQNGNVITVERGLFGSSAAAHAAQTLAYWIWVRGDGTYAQNMVGNTYVVDNIAFGNNTIGLKAFGETGYFNGFYFGGNTIFSNSSAQLFVGGGSKPVDFTIIRDNSTFIEPNIDSVSAIRLGYVTPGNQYVELVQNRIVGGRILQIQDFERAKVRENLFAGEYGDQILLIGITGAATFPGLPKYQWDFNTYVTSHERFGLSGAKVWDFDEPLFTSGPYAGYQGWRQWTGFDTHSSISTDFPKTIDVVVRPNQYERGRGTVTVYNHSNLSQVSVDLSPLGLSIGSAFTVRDVQNPYGTPLLQGTYQGQPIVLPLQLTEVDPIPGLFLSTQAHTSSQFNCFLVTPSVAFEGNEAPVARDQFLSYSKSRAMLITPQSFDPNLDPLTLSIVSYPSTGTLALVNDADGKQLFLYVPDGTSDGPISFTYRASDGVLTSKDAQVTLSVTPLEASPLARGVPSGGSVEVTLAGSGAGPSDLRYVPVTRPSGGNLNKVLVGDPYYTDPHYTFVPFNSASGELHFSYFIHSSNRFSLPQDVYIRVNPANDSAPPAIMRTDDSHVLADGKAIIWAVTDEYAECRFSNSSSVAFDQLGPLQLTYGTRHGQIVSGLSSFPVKYYLRCKDIAGNLQQVPVEVVIGSSLPVKPNAPSLLRVQSAS